MIANIRSEIHPVQVKVQTGHSSNRILYCYNYMITHPKESYRMCIKDYETKIGGQSPVRAVELLMNE
jgi:hypothetical protein